MPWQEVTRMSLRQEFSKTCMRLTTMANAKKYDYRVVQDKTAWLTEITRRVTSKKTVVSNRQGGFSSEAEAEAWGQSELKTFVQNLGEINKRRSKK